MTIYDDALVEVLARLQSSPPMMTGADEITWERSHATIAQREDCPTGRLLDGPDKPTEGKGCDTAHDADFTVRIILRGDEESVSAAAWAIADEVLARLNPLTTAYANSVQLSEPTITPDREVADLDLYALDMLFRMKYRTAQWSLSA